MKRETMSRGARSLKRRRISGGKRLAFVVAQDAAFAARRFREQDAELVQPGRVELIELHVHQRHAAPVGDRDAVAGAGVRIRRDLEDAAESAGRDQHAFACRIV